MYGSLSIQYLHKSFFNQQQKERPMTYFFRSIVSCLWELLNGIKCVCVFVCFLSFWAAVVVAAVVLLGRIARVNYCLSVHNPERLETGAIWPILWLCAVKSDETNKLPETMAWVSYLGNVPVCYTGNKINPPSQDIYFLSAMTSESEQFLQQKQKQKKKRVLFIAGFEPVDFGMEVQRLSSGPCWRVQGPRKAAINIWG